MSKLKNMFLVMILVLCVVPIFSACKDDDSPVINIDERIYVSNVVLDPESKSIPLLKDATYQLKYSFEPLEATNKTVEFSTSNANVATVDKYGNVTAVGTGSCYITVKSLDNKNALSDVAVVNVVNEKEKLAKPLNPYYDGTKLSWSAVEVKSSTTFVPRYEVKISRNGGAEETYITSATYYTNLPYGKYNVTLRTLGDDENILYDNSDSTDTYTFTKLGMITELNVTASGDIDADSDPDRKYTLSFTLAENSTSISDYEYRITPVSGSSTISNAQMSIWETAIASGKVIEQNGQYIAQIEIPKTISNDPVYVVFGSKDDATNNVYGSGYTNAPRVQVGRLTAPKELSVSSKNSGEGVQSTLTWENVTNADKYKLKVVYKMSGSEDIIIYDLFDAWGVNSYDMSILKGVPSSYDSYEVYLYALGVDDASATALVLMDSESSQCARQQLSSVKGEITITPADEKYTITWSAVSNAKSYRVYISDNDLDIVAQNDLRYYDVSTPSCEIGFNWTIDSNSSESIWNIGNNYIKIVAIAEAGSTYDNSAVAKAGKTLIKLATPDLRVSKGQLVWDVVSNAETYTIDFGNGHTKVVNQSDKTANGFAYEPTSTDFGGSTTCEVSIVVTNDNDYIIKSQASQKMQLNLFNKILQSSIKIVEGNLTWVTDSGIVDINNKKISTNNVQVKITDESGSELKTVTSSGGTLSLADTLSDVESNNNTFKFSVRAVSVSSSGSNDINGIWSEEIKTYQMEAPTNLRISEGVLTWDRINDTKVGTANDGIRYIIKLNNAELSSVNLKIGDTSTVLQNLNSSQSYSISIQTKIVSSSTGSILASGTNDTYLVNSSFSEPINVKIATKPMDLNVSDHTLSWGTSGSGISTYRVYFYKSGESVPLLSYEDVKPADIYNPSFDFSTEAFDKTFIVEGNYEFVVQAVGDNSTYLTSYMSSPLTICKLATPTITVSDLGKISWTNSVSNLDGVQEMINKFYIVVKTKDGDTEYSYANTLSTTSTDLSFLTDEAIWCGKEHPLTLTIQALNNNRNRVYNSNAITYTINESDTSSSTIVYKLPKISTENITINENSQTIEWNAGEYSKASGYYRITVYQKDSKNKDQLLEEVLVTADQTGKASYRIPASWTGTSYYVRIQQQGYATSVNNVITRCLTSEYSEPKYFVRFNEATGICLSHDNGEPVLNWSALSGNEHQRFRITLQKLDSDGNASKTNQLIYYVAYDSATVEYALNLYDTAGIWGNDESVQKTLKELSDDGSCDGEYQMSITVVQKEGETYLTEGDRQYLLLSSRSSAKQTMTIYSAPSVQVDGSSVKIVNPNSSSRGVKLIFQEVVETDGVYNATGAELPITLGASEDYYEVTASQLTPGKLYQVTTQALGNGANLVNSSAEISELLITKLATLTPNTVTATVSDGKATNYADFNGWYIQSGNVCWNEIEGASGYKIYMTSGTTQKVVLDKNSGHGTYCEVLSDMSFASNYGVFTMQFQVKGGGNSSDTTEKTIAGKIAKIGYLSSDLSTGTYVNKLLTPNGTYNNAKIVWNVRLPTGNIDADKSKDIYRKGAYARINEDGEFDFGIRDGGGSWIDESGATKYLVSIKGTGTTTTSYPDIEYDLTTDEGKQATFTASEIFKGTTMSSAGTYMISMYSIGNDWFTYDESAPIFITSDAQDSFKLIYSGVIDDLGVTDGNITWLENYTNAINSYDLKYKLNVDSAYNSISLTTRTFAFEGYDELKGQLIDEIKVRFKGIPTEKNAIEGYVNTEWNETPLTRIMKLPNISKTTMGIDGSTEDVDLFINDVGQLAWTEGTDLSDLEDDNNTTFYFNISHEVRVGDTVVQTKNSTNVELEKQVYTVPRVNETSQTGSESVSYIYDIVAYVKGTSKVVDGKSVTIYADTVRSSNNSAEILFLNGSEYNFSAGKLNRPKDNTFLLDKANGGVRISWDLDGCSIKVVTDTASTDVEADVVMLSYYLGNDMQNLITKKLSASEFKFTDLLTTEHYKGGTAFWQLGTFRDMKLSVLNSTGKAFGSETISLDEASVEFTCFESGTGTRNDPFIITTIEQFSNMYWLPEKYFRLANDITLPNLATLQEKYATARINILYPDAFYDTDSSAKTKYVLMNFTGGFDGAGHTIKNYQVISSTSMSIWNTLTGAEIDKLILEDGTEFDDTVYRNMSGIITNLTVEVNTLDVSLLRSYYNGVIVSTNAGLIYNCHVTGDNNKKNSADNREAVVTGKFTVDKDITSNNKYFIGGIAGRVTDNKAVTKILNYGADNAKTLFKQAYVGRIENCTNMLDLEVYNNGGNYDVSVGGIAGFVCNGKVVNCTNGTSSPISTENSGKVSGFYAGGIVGYSLGVAFDMESENEPYYTSNQYYSYIYGCTNFAKVNSQSIIIEGNKTASIAGGIVGVMGYSYVTYCINYGEVTTDGACAFLGGIAGSAYEGAYMVSTLNGGTITYNEYYTTEETTLVACGALCGIVSNTLVLYNSAINSQCIICHNADDTYTYSSAIVFTSEDIQTGTVYDNKIYTSNNLSEETLENLQSQASINSYTITIEDTSSLLDVIFENVDGNYPRFTFDSTAKLWTFTWGAKYAEAEQSQ